MTLPYNNFKDHCSARKLIFVWSDNRFEGEGLIYLQCEIDKLIVGSVKTFQGIITLAGIQFHGYAWMKTSFCKRTCQNCFTFKKCKKGNYVQR